MSSVYLHLCRRSPGMICHLSLQCFWCKNNMCFVSAGARGSVLPGPLPVSHSAGEGGGHGGRHQEGHPSGPTNLLLYILLTRWGGAGGGNEKVTMKIDHFLGALFGLDWLRVAFVFFFNWGEILWDHYEEIFSGSVWCIWISFKYWRYEWFRQIKSVLPGSPGWVTPIWDWGTTTWRSSTRTMRLKG